MKDFTKILKSFTHKRVLVLGDIMLDHYIWGKVDRISPEAPVPVLDVQKEEFRLGGAANVALNLKAMGASVYLCGITGKDEAGGIIKQLLSEKGIDAISVITESKRSTTKKTRILAGNQQIVRIDYEEKTDIPKQTENQIIKQLHNQISKMDAVIIEDYNKGLLTEKVIENAIEYAREQHKIIAVDPKQKNFFHYKEADVFKPNYSEMQKNLGVIFENEAEFERQAWLLRVKLKCRDLVVTRGERGLYIFSEDNQIHHIPTFAREVYDVSGAGDTVISALTLSMCSGCDIVNSAIIANHAAGVVCGKAGTATPTINEIIQSYHDKR